MKQQCIRMFFGILSSWRGPCVVVLRLKNMKALSRVPVIASRYRRPILVSLPEHKSMRHYAQATQQTLASLPKRKLEMQF